MDEKTWLTCTDPSPMLAFLRGRASDRKLRLFVVACCLRLWDLLDDRRSRNAVEVAERTADGLAAEEECRSAEGAARAVWEAQEPRDPEQWPSTAEVAVGSAWAVLARGPWEAALGWLLHSATGSRGAPFKDPVYQCAVLRNLFGSLSFRLAALDPAWRTPTVRKLAEAIYEERAFDRLPILADALEEAGCNDAGVLGHCRGPGPHARGCWVTDLVLGKE
jgi:hypothetical protein